MAKRIMRKFRIDEISAVDVPAQAGARVTIMKRDSKAPKKGDQAEADLEEEDAGDAEDAVDKAEADPRKKNKRKGAAGGVSMVMPPESGEPDADDQGGPSDDDEDDAAKATFTADERKKLADSGAAMPDGSFPIRNASDLSNALHAQGRSKHSSEVVRAHIRRRAKALGLESSLPDSFGESAKKSATNGDDMEKQQELEKRIASLEADLAEANKIAKMSRTDRDAAEEASNPVVHKAIDGTLFRKNDDPRLVAMAKRNDALETEREGAEFSKRAGEELKNLPGSPVAKVALLRAIAGISDEAVRGQVSEIVKAAASGLAKAFVRAGTSAGSSESGNPVEKLNAMAKSLADKQGIPFGKAYDQVLRTPEGEALYRQTTPTGAGI